MIKNYKKYEHAVIATDIVVMAIIGNELNVVLIQMNKAPYERMWAAPGGIVKGDESIDEAAERVLLEKAGIKNVYMEQLSTFGKVDRDPFGRVVSVAYFGLVSHIPTIKTTVEHKNIQWYPINNLPSLAYDHKEIIKSAVIRLKERAGASTIVSKLMPTKFTLAQLQQVFEIILGKKLDKRNFRKKINELGIVKDTGQQDLGGAHRPAKLFSFKAQKAINIEIF